MLDINDENNLWKCVCEIQKVFKNISSEFKSPHRSKQVFFFFCFFLQFLTLSALLHTSASLSACKRLHGSANYPLSMPSPLYPCYDSCPPLFLLPSPPSSSSIPPSFNFPLHSVRDRFCFCHNHLICFRKKIIHIWRALIDLYSVITPFSIVS